MGKNAPDPSDLPIKVILKIWVSRKKVLVDSTIFDKVQKKSPFSSFIGSPSLAIILSLFIL